MNAAECLAQNIKLRRRKLNLTQETLAEIADLSVPFVQSIEGQRQWPSAETISKLARALRTTETALFFDPSLRLNAERVLSIVERLVRRKRRDET